MDDPYRTQAIVPVIPQSKQEHVLFIYGKCTAQCPICGRENTPYQSIYGNYHEKKMCNPFHRIILKKHWFKPDLVCNLSGAHYHCWCFCLDCDTHWIVVINDHLDVREI